MIKTKNVVEMYKKPQWCLCINTTESRILTNLLDKNSPLTYNKQGIPNAMRLEFFKEKKKVRYYDKL